MNPIAKAKRVVRYKKMLASPEYRKTRALAMERAGNQCEAEMMMVHPLKPSKSLGVARCGVVDPLHAHHLRYPKSRPLEARDLKILCKDHHEYLESQKLGKTRMF